jgi:hypothetical protein
MSEVVPNSPQEFWRPPVIPHPSSSVVEACHNCGIEFMVGAKFCHACGTQRGLVDSSPKDWLGWLGFLRVLEFHSLKERLGLPVASLVAFFAGLGCILAAIGVSLVYSAQHVDDFEAVHLWRIEWLIAAIVAFVAGILLKKSQA